MASRALCVSIVLSLCCLFLPASQVFADEASVSLEVPETAKPGERIAIKIHVYHDGNSFFHYVDWVSIKADDMKIAHWTFDSEKLPEAGNFTREISYVMEKPVVIVGQANCNIHGSKGPVKARIELSDSRKKVQKSDPIAASPKPAMATNGHWLGKTVKILGIINFFLLLFQVATGRRWIKVRYGVHRKTGTILFVTAAIHGIIGLLL